MLNSSTRVTALYVDPGSGALIWQTVLAVVAGGVFRFRSFFLNLVKRKK